MHIEDLIEQIDKQVVEYIQQHTTHVKDLSKLGLDQRASYTGLYLNDHCIIVDKISDRNLQYYGGFEYIDKDYRYEVGRFYVIYSNDKMENRVQNCIERYMEHVSADA